MTSTEVTGTGRAVTTITTWNLVSRVTGFVRVIATTTALGIAALGDTYHRSNQVSNVLFELLAGGMLFSVLIPSLVAELHGGGRERTRAMASMLATRGALVLAGVVAVGVLLSRPIMDLLTVGASETTREAQAELGTFLLWFILPQIVFYGVGAVASALLQADRRFLATSMAPTLNNLVVTATMVAFGIVHDPAAGLALTGGEKLLLGGGTFAGTVAMTLVPLVALRAAGLSIRPQWSAPNVDLGPILRRGLWGAGHIGLNQVMILVTVILVGGVDGGVIAYQTAFTFFLLPHALLAHPIFTAMFPRLASRGSGGDRKGFARDLGVGLRAMLLLLVPASAALAVVTPPALSIVQFGQLDADGTHLVSVTLAAYLVGLAGFSAFFMLTRAEYALEDARRPTIISLWCTLGAVVGMILVARSVEGSAVMVGLGLVHAASVSIASWWLHHHLQRTLDHPVPVAATLVRILAGTAIATAAGWGIAGWIGWSSTGTAITSIGAAVVVLGVLYTSILKAMATPELDLIQNRVLGVLRGLR